MREEDGGTIVLCSLHASLDPPLPLRTQQPGHMTGHMRQHLADDQSSTRTAALTRVLHPLAVCQIA